MAIVPLTGKQPPGQLQVTDTPSANDSTDNITRQSSSSSFQILSRSSSSSSVAGVSSHGSDGPQLLPQGTSGVLGAGLLAASFGGGVPINNATERLKNELIPPSMLVLEQHYYLYFLLTIISVSVGGVASWTMGFDMIGQGMGNE